MNDIRVLFEVTLKQENGNFDKWYDTISKKELLEEYDISTVAEPVMALRKEFINYILQYGFSSLLNFTISLEDITSPSMDINQIEEIILRYTSQLNNSKKIIITDPYLYAGKSEDLDIFTKIFNSFSNELEEIILITSSQHTRIKSEIHNIIKTNPDIKIIEHENNEFHDRFWISFENKVGIVMGTSLNGIGKKIALVDKLSLENLDKLQIELERLNII